MKKILLICLIFTLSLGVSILIVLLFSDTNKNTQTSTLDSPVDQIKEIETDNLKTGFSLSPRSFEGNDFKEFFVKTSSSEEVVTWVGQWEELSDKSSAPYTVATLSKQYNLEPVIIVHPSSSNNTALQNPLTEEQKEIYRDTTIEFIDKFKPSYFGIGVEINILFENNPNDFQDFLSFFNEMALEIKDNSPKTKVFTVFQLERIKGLRGGLFGGENNIENNNWELINKFTESDLIVFTSYPGLIFNDPTDIPSDYYTDIKNFTDKPIAFSELGWPRDLNFPDWESNIEEQSLFIERFFELTSELNSSFVIWSFLFDVENDNPVFSTSGLLSKEEESNISYLKWLSQN